MDENSEWSVLHFSQSNPAGEGQENAAALLRRIAESIDALGPSAEIQDIVFNTSLEKGEDWPTMTVYYHLE